MNDLMLHWMLIVYFGIKGFEALFVDLIVIVGVHFLLHLLDGVNNLKVLFVEFYCTCEGVFVFTYSGLMSELDGGGG